MGGADIEQAVRDHVVANYAVGSGSAAVGPDDDLLLSGLVDSMGVMEIIAFMEEAFGITVDDEDIVPENFRSLKAMADYVATKSAAGVASAERSSAS